jgi:2-hydroxychromene-2-carboxylate isomerase
MALTDALRLRVVEVFADVVCPFTHVGLRRLVSKRAELDRHDVALWVRAWPLELVNGEPLSAALVAEEITALRELVAPELFTGFDPDRFPSSSLPALALASSAYAHGVEVGEQVSLALRTALFERGRDLADPAEVATIAQSFDLEYPGSAGGSRASASATGVVAGTEQSVLEDWNEGRRRGVLGSPQFFVGGEAFFCPTLTIAHVGDSLRVTLDQEGFDAFLASVFGDRRNPGP